MKSNSEQKPTSYVHVNWTSSATGPYWAQKGPLSDQGKLDRQKERIAYMHEKKQEREAARKEIQRLKKKQGIAVVEKDN